jgi:uncharacterized membrane protein YphA (DoxX/SURF4 family)
MATEIWQDKMHYHTGTSAAPIVQHTTQTLALAVGRVIFGGFFIYAGLHHFLSLNELTGFTAAKGVPFPELAVAGSGAMVLLGGLSVLTGFHPRVGASLIILFLLGVTPAMHNFWTEQGPARVMDMGNFMKNVALIGGACLAAALPTPWPSMFGRHPAE